MWNSNLRMALCDQLGRQSFSSSFRRQQLHGFAEMEILKQRMQDHPPYALCMSEVGSGFRGDGSHGGCGILLSPAGSKAWRLDGSKAEGCSSGHVLRLSMRLAANEGRWHLFSVYGPTMQRSDVEKTAYWSDLKRLWEQFLLDKWLLSSVTSTAVLVVKFVVKLQGVTRDSWAPLVFFRRMQMVIFSFKSVRIRV